MEPSLFESFSHLIGQTPAHLVIKTLEREGRQLVEDLVNKRPWPMEEVESILVFWQFVEMARAGLPLPVRCIRPPAAHLSFYLHTISRLVAARELSATVRDKFEFFFSARAADTRQCPPLAAVPPPPDGAESFIPAPPGQPPFTPPV